MNARSTTALHAASPLSLLLLLLLLLLLASTSKGENKLAINNTDDLMTFAWDVNSGKNHSGTTVFLANDLVFDASSSNNFESIGSSSTLISFCGVFDGQGHTISNLSYTQKAFFGGLFGAANGATIRNIVVDESCAFNSAMALNAQAYFGGIVGWCKGLSGPCVVENIVSMGMVVRTGPITTSASATSFLYMGGIVGMLAPGSYSSILRNCANYGNVSVQRNAASSYIGGVVGGCDTSFSSQKLFVQNCLNYGTIDFDAEIVDAKFYVYVGGITGHLWNNCDVENCVSAGKISFKKTITDRTVIGGIAGNAFREVDITHNFVTADVGYGVLGYDGNKPNVTMTEEVTEVNSSVLEKLNSFTVTQPDFTDEGSGSESGSKTGKWFSNQKRSNVSFSVNGKVVLTYNSPVFMYPNYTNETSETEFDGWYEDKECTRKISSYEITGDTTFYGRLASEYVIPSNSTVPTHSSDSSSSEQKSSTHSSESSDASSSEQKNPTHSSSSEHKSPTHSSSSEQKKSSYSSESTHSSSSKISPKSSDSQSTSSSSSSSSSQSSDEKESEFKSEYVEIVFDRKDMKKEEVEEIIVEYADEESFDIVKIEPLPDDTTYVIVKFVDEDTATSFIEEIKVDVDYWNIKKVGFINENAFSYSSTLCHFLPFLAFLF